MSHFKIQYLLLVLSLVACVRGPQPDILKCVGKYNLYWDTPGYNSLGSLPIGNGNIGANVWIEDNGDLVFLISQTNAWSEIGSLMKLGRVRVALSPNPFKKEEFSQELKLQDGTIFFDYGDLEIKFWIDANNPVIQTDILSKTPVQAKVTYENWRREPIPLVDGVGEGAYVWGIGPNQMSGDCNREIYQEADSIEQGNKKHIMAYHHNAYSIFENNLDIQAIANDNGQFTDPLLNLNFGVVIKGEGMQNVSDTVLINPEPSTHVQMQVFPLIEQNNVQAWKRNVLKQASIIESMDEAKRVEAHKTWWKNFWDRSYIFISSEDSIANEEAVIVTQGYLLQRYVNACGGRGNSPIKFNGSIFTVDTYLRIDRFAGNNPDYRQWGGCYWFQNTRLPYWSMISSGDFDMMQPFFKMYMDALPLRKAATQKYYNHAGAFFPETMNFWGTYADGDYGCDRDTLPDGYVKNPFIRYYWSNGLELSMIMNDYYAFTKSNSFAQDTLVPFVSEILTFYDQHWERNSEGKIVFDPAMSLETYHTAKNPAPEIVGIRSIAEKMLQLPIHLTGKEKRMQWKKLIADLPDLPLKTVNGQVLLDAAEEYSNKANEENPEMYAVFPYRAYGIGKPDLDIALRTFDAKAHKQNGGWQQNSIQAAYLGLSDEAKGMIIESFSTHDKHFRFPAFWGPNYDWTPDQCHGSVAMIALQRMLLQYEDDDIILLPSWPKEWDVHFKLNIPGNRRYEGIYNNGKLKEINAEY
ncbi:MAG: hypothetical protein JEZ14_01810 [Marinilabiliaceae bacterium]|nr:hypothetical protein [Marinilabiliaceae bacterium]